MSVKLHARITCEFYKILLPNLIFNRQFCAKFLYLFPSCLLSSVEILFLHGVIECFVILIHIVVVLIFVVAIIIIILLSFSSIIQDFSLHCLINLIHKYCAKFMA